MNNPPKCLSVFTEFSDSFSKEALYKEISIWIRRNGFRYWIYAQGFPPSPLTKSPFVFGNYPDDWIQHYFESDYIHVDPTIQHCRERVTPYIWPPTGQIRKPGKIREFFNEARQFRLLRGITFPLHGPGKYRGLFSVALDHFVSERDVSELAPCMMLMGSMVHEKIITILDGDQESSDRQLTPREQECLTWAAIGKSSWEIGKLLKITERTVNFHLGNAGRKLGVASRQSAVAHAVSRGLIIL
ncbi:helix-turn-helix transcriptional regulator [Microbulbifer litoralis]|uniref:helix-turn-helix transcriptional regulator n=1 Tax=Microbulbifer litoralis TaxID=2933965 RepID=UPI0020288E1B|nr:LuxR family transcriptional regulator [Microbulbifer sp. GX H0434]